MIEDILKEDMPIAEKVALFNTITQELYDWLGFNKVAPPEMKLLKLSIRKDGLTMPVVVADAPNDKKHPYVVVP